MARASLTPATRTPCDDSQVSLYNENFVRTRFVSPEETQSSASPVARASLKPATHTPCDDSQVSCYSETFVPANQSSILFRATPLRQQRLNDSGRKKRSGSAFPCAFHVNVECSCLELCAFVSFLHVLHISHQDPVNHKQTNNYKPSVPEQRFARGLGHGASLLSCVLVNVECSCLVVCAFMFLLHVRHVSQ